MTHHPPPEFGIFVVRSPACNPARKIQLLTESLIEKFGQAPDVAGRTVK